MKRAVIIVGAIIAGTSTAAAVEAVDGQWATTVANCTAQFTDDGMTLDTTRGRIDFFETGCDIRAWTSVGDYGAAWTATLACSGEGDAWTEQAVFGLYQPYEGNDRLAVIYLTDGYTTVYERCSGPVNWPVTKSR